MNQKVATGLGVVIIIITATTIAVFALLFQNSKNNALAPSNPITKVQPLE